MPISEQKPGIKPISEQKPGTALTGTTARTDTTALTGTTAVASGQKYYSEIKSDTYRCLVCTGFQNFQGETLPKIEKQLSDMHGIQVLL